MPRTLRAGLGLQQVLRMSRAGMGRSRAGTNQLPPAQGHLIPTRALFHTNGEQVARKKWEKKAKNTERSDEAGAR